MIQLKKGINHHETLSLDLGCGFALYLYRCHAGGDLVRVAHLALVRLSVADYARRIRKQVSHNEARAMVHQYEASLIERFSPRRFSSIR